MANRGRKKRAAPRSSAVASSSVVSGVEDRQEASNGDEFANRQRAFNNQEVERRVAAIQAICTAETEDWVTRLRLLKSYVGVEQLKSPALKFFQENLPNLSIIKNEKHRVYELARKGPRNDLPDNRCGFNFPVSDDLLRLSAATVKGSYLETLAMQIPDIALSGAFDNLNPTTGNGFQTPGDCRNRLSFGMTPKSTTRLPKKGEMLMSVRGSPLGVFNENLEAIHESGDGSGGDGGC